MKIEQFIAKQKQHSDNILERLKEYDFIKIHQHKYSDIDIDIDDKVYTFVFDILEGVNYICFFLGDKNICFFLVIEILYLKKKKK